MRQQKTHKLLSLLLALVVLLALAVPAFAADGDEPPAKELRMDHLDWDENGQCFAREDTLNMSNGDGGSGTGFNPTRGDYVIFFIWNNQTQKKEKFVVPEGNDDIRVIKVDSQDIAKGARQAQYYVRLEMDEWKDTTLTCDGLTFHVNAMMDDFAFFSSQTFSPENYLGNEVNKDTLTGNTVYFGNSYAGTEEADQHDKVTSVEKINNGQENFYTLEKVNDNCWRIKYKDVFDVWGDVGVDLKLEILQPDGETREHGRGLWIYKERAPQLQFVWLSGEWSDEENRDIFFFDPERRDAASGLDLQPGNSAFGILGYGGDWDENGFVLDNFTPVSVKDVKLPEGVTANTDVPAKKDAKWAEYYVELSVTEQDKDYTLTCKNPKTNETHEFTIYSRLPSDVGVYSAPKASWKNWLGNWGFPYNALLENEYYLISTATDGRDGRHLTSMALSTEWEDEHCANGSVELARVSDGVYKLTLKEGAVSLGDFHVDLDITWTDVAGNTWTDENRYLGNFDYCGVVMASETSLGLKTGASSLPASDAAGKVSSTVTIKAGEAKTLYLYRSAYSGSRGPIVYCFPYPNFFHSDDKELTLIPDEADRSKFTLSSSKAGVYEIYTGFGVDLTALFHADGTRYTAEEKAEFEENVVWDIDPNNLNLIVCDDISVEDPKFVSFEEMFPGDSYEIKFLDEDWEDIRLTVTVEPSYVDAASGDWFYDDVCYVSVNGMMGSASTTEQRFNPNGKVKREMVPTVLYRLDGEPAVKAGSFTDVVPGAYYADAAAWGAANEIVKGVGDNAFGVGSNITREQLAAMLYRYAEYKGCDMTASDDLSAFPDAGNVHSWALKEMRWAVGAGIINGKGGSLVPQGNASRAELATMLARFCRDVL